MKEAIAGESKSSSPLLGWAKERITGVLDELIAGSILAIVAYAVNRFRNPFMYVTAFVIVVLVVIIYLAWQRRR